MATKLVFFSRIFATSENFNELSQEKQFELRTINVFQKIDENGFITNVNWYLNLSRIQYSDYF